MVRVPNETRDALITAFRQRICEVCEIVPFTHQAAWWAATDGAILTDVEDTNGTLVRCADKTTTRLGLLPRPGGRARVVADLGSYKIGKSFSTAIWLASFACIPDARIQLVGLEYDICEPEFQYIVDTLLGDRGMNLAYDSLQNRPRDGKMYLDMANGCRYEAKSWERKDTLKGKEVDAMGMCLPAGAPIWMGDYTTRPIEQVALGDEIIGWVGASDVGTARKTGARLVKTRVTHLHQRSSPIVEIQTAYRTVRCTPDHRWLTYDGGSGQWQRADQVHIGSGLGVVDADDPGECPPALSGLAAWLGGLYDGEGCGVSIAQSERSNAETLTDIEQALTALGFAYGRYTNHNGGVVLRLKGGRSAALKFARWIPARRFRRKYADRVILGARFRRYEKIISIREIPGVFPVHCLTTGTGNFVAWGALSHNCEAYMLPGLECYTSFSQNLRARDGYVIFATTPDRPWVKQLHDCAHSGDKEFVAWHCTCNIDAKQNPYTYSQSAADRDKTLMTREKYAIHYEGKLGEFVGRVYNYQRGERTFSPGTHPALFAADGRFACPMGWELMAAADTGTFTSALIVAFSPDGNAFVIEEFPNYSYVSHEIELDEASTIPSWAATLNLALQQYGAKHALWADQNSQFKHELQRYNLTLMSNKVPGETRTEIAREYFTQRKVWLNSTLRILPLELENAQWPEDATAAGKFTRRKHHDHTLDCFEHVLSRRPRGHVPGEPTVGRWLDQFTQLFPERRAANVHLGNQ